MNVWEALALPLSVLSIGIAVGILFHGFPTFIKINKNYYNQEKVKD